MGYVSFIKDGEAVFMEIRAVRTRASTASWLARLFGAKPCQGRCIGYDYIANGVQVAASRWDGVKLQQLWKPGWGFVFCEPD